MACSRIGDAAEVCLWPGRTFTWALAVDGMLVEALALHAAGQLKNLTMLDD